MVATLGPTYSGQLLAAGAAEELALLLQVGQVGICDACVVLLALEESALVACGGRGCEALVVRASARMQEKQVQGPLFGGKEASE